MRTSSVPQRCGARCRLFYMTQCVQHAFMPSMCQRTAGLWDAGTMRQEDAPLRPRSVTATGHPQSGSTAQSSPQPNRQRPQSAKPVLTQDHSQARTSRRARTQNGAHVAQHLPYNSARESGDVQHGINAAGRVAPALRQQLQQHGGMTRQSTGNVHARKRTSTTAAALDSVGELLSHCPAHDWATALCAPWQWSW